MITTLALPRGAAARPSPERPKAAIWGGQPRAVDARKTRAGAALGAEHVEHVDEHGWGAGNPIFFLSRSSSWN
jgi:hypothetical protein